MKKFAALLLVLVMVLSFAACGGKTDPEETTLPEEITSAEEISSEPVSEDTSAEVTEEVTSDVGGVDASEVVTEISSAPAATTPATPATAPAAPAAPSSKAEIVALYNSAVNSAVDAKAGFNKARYVDGESFELSLALKPFRSLVEKFVGIGADNRYSETVTQGKWDSDPKRAYLRNSTISEADLTGATCTKDGGFYVVTLNIKDGNSHGGKSNNSTNAPVDKCGICVGTEDKGYYDHKTGEVIYSAIGGTYAGADISESYNSAKAVAKIDAATGKLVSLTVTYKIKVAIDIGIGSGIAAGNSHIEYTNVKY